MRNKNSSDQELFIKKAESSPKKCSLCSDFSSDIFYCFLGNCFRYGVDQFLYFQQSFPHAPMRN